MATPGGSLQSETPGQKERRGVQKSTFYSETPSPLTSHPPPTRGHYAEPRPESSSHDTTAQTTGRSVAGERVPAPGTQGCKRAPAGRHRGDPPHPLALQECSRLRPATLWRKAAELAPPLPRPAARPSRAATVTRCARAAAPRPATPSPPRSSPSLTSRRPEPASMPPRNSRPRAEVRGRTPLPNPQPRPRPLRAVRRPPAPPQPPLSCFGAARGGDGRPTRLACVTSGLRARPIRSVRALVGGPAQEFLRGRGGARAPRRGQAQVT